MTSEIIDIDISYDILKDSFIYDNISHDSNNKTVITTITNNGYILYTLNMLKSLKRFGLDKKVFIVCMDSKSYNTFKKLGYNSYLIDLKINNFVGYNKKGYDIICYYKMLYIYKLTTLNVNVFYIDGDVVFMNNPLENLSNWIKSDKDTWIQNDTMNNYDYRNMCMGVIFVKSTEQSLKHFKCDTEDSYNYYKNICSFNNNDQTYFNNRIKGYVNIGLMPLELYPNGQYFYKYPHLKETCILVHFNWIQGNHKLVKMKEYNMWLLTEDEEELLSI